MKTTHRTEHEFQKNCYLEINQNYPELRGRLFAIPNGSYKSRAEANKYLVEGLLAGVPDMAFLSGGVTSYIEMKKDKGGKLQPVQEKQIDLMIDSGFVVYLIRGDYRAFFSALDLMCGINPKGRLNVSTGTIEAIGYEFKEWEEQQNIFNELLNNKRNMFGFNSTGEIVQRFIDWQFDTSNGFSLEIKGSQIIRKELTKKLR